MTSVAGSAGTFFLTGKRYHHLRQVERVTFTLGATVFSIQIVVQWIYQLYNDLINVFLSLQL